ATVIKLIAAPAAASQLQRRFIDVSSLWIYVASGGSDRPTLSLARLRRAQSVLHCYGLAAPATCTALPHFCCSAVIKSAKACGVLLTTSPPNASIRSRIFGVATMRDIS